jgi:uncharacterized membrane protein required for colicin V production
MSFILTFLLLIMIAACVGMAYNEGMWTNAIRLINVVTAALLATNFFEPLAAWLQSMMPSATYLCDFASLWVLFIVSVLVLSEVTNWVSQVNVKFLKIVDQIGGGFFALWIGYVMVCFTMMTLHTAPMSRTFLFGGFQPEQRMFFRLAPDRDWLGFMQKMSLGPFSSSDKDVFDKDGEFMLKYASRRKMLEDQIAANGALLSDGK